MKCHNCGEECVPSVCFPNSRLTPKWTVHYCTNKGCHFSSHLVPQVPKQKPVDILTVRQAAL